MYRQLLKPVYIFLLLSSMCMADTDEKTEYTYIDEVHRDISNKIVDWADILDNNISSWLGDKDVDSSCEVEYPIIKPSTADSVDSFFQNEKYLNETRDIYVRLRIRSDFYSRESESVNVRVSARLPFDKCKKQWNIFLQDVSANEPEVKETDTSNSGVGVSFNKKGKFGIDASYSVGLQSSYPYVRVRYRLPMKFDTWEIEPVQTFKYSIKYYFEEETNIYFDKFFDKNNLFRMQLHRKSASTLNGTDYGLTLQYFLNLEQNRKLEVRQSFFGNTFYNDFYEFDEDYNGINNYVTSVSWRENIWRDWFYYEIKPSVNFHKDHNFDPSYFIRFNFDFYFGIFNK